MARRRLPRLLGALALAAALVAIGLALVGRPETLVAAGRDRALSLAAERAGPGLARWLAASAQQARAEGVAPMPAEIRRALAGFVDDGVLDRVRYRIGGGKTTSVQSYVFLHPHTRAITLDGVIVFRDPETAAKPRYWVHEIAHLEQISRWGLAGFAERYVRDGAGVESEAWDLTGRYVAWALRRELEEAANAHGADAPAHGLRPAQSYEIQLPRMGTDVIGSREAARRSMQDKVNTLTHRFAGPSLSHAPRGRGPHAPSVIARNVSLSRVRHAQVGEGRGEGICRSEPDRYWAVRPDRWLSRLLAEQGGVPWAGVLRRVRLRLDPPYGLMKRRRRAGRCTPADAPGS